MILAIKRSLSYVAEPSSINKAREGMCAVLKSESRFSSTTWMEELWARFPRFLLLIPTVDQ